MNEQNQFLLNSIQTIEESVLDTELNVLISLGDEYYKTALLLEYASDEAFNELEVFQEASIIEKNAKAAKKESNDKANERKSVLKRIIDWFKNIGRIIINFIKRIFNISDENIKNELPPKNVQRHLIAKGHKEIYNWKEVSGYEQYWDNDHPRVLTPKEVEEAQSGDQYIKIISKEYNQIAGHDIYKGIFLKADFKKPIFEEINAFEKRPWSDWVATMEFYVLGGYGDMIQHLLTENMILDKQFDNIHARTMDDYIDSHPLKSRVIGEKYVKMKADQVVSYNIRKIIKSQKEWKKICNDVMKNKWTKMITVKSFEESLSHFKDNPKFTHEGELVLESDVVANKDSKMSYLNKPFMFILDPTQLTIKVRTKEDNLQIDLANYINSYEMFSKLFADTVQDNRKDFKAVGNDFIKSYNELVKKLSKTSNKDLTIYELADLLNNNGKTFAKAKENMDVFNRGIDRLIEKDESNDNELKGLFVKMSSMGKEFTELLGKVQTLLKYSKDALIIFKVYIAFLECVGSKGYVSGDFILTPEIGFDKVHLVQFMKHKEWRHYKH
jgi:hypothetical protein